MGLLRFTSKVTFTKYNDSDEVEQVYTLKNAMSEAEWDSGIDDLTDTFKIKMPRNLMFKGKSLFAGENPIFAVGDQVKVEAGYFPNVYTVFEGYISAVSAKIPVEVQCEDKMWILKNMTVTYPVKRNVSYYSVLKSGKLSKKPLKKPKVTSANITLKDLLEHCVPDGIELASDVPDVNIGQFRATNVSPAKIFEELKTKYGLYTYFTEGKLYSGFAFRAAKSNTYKYVFEKALPNAVIDDSSLEYQLAKHTSIKVVAKLISLNNTYEEITVGDPDGAQRTIHTYWNGTGKKPDLKAFAENELKTKKYDGYRGVFTTFGYYPIQAGDIVNLTSKKYPERDGNYLVKSVKGTVSKEGYRHNIEIANKV